MGLNQTKLHFKVLKEDWDAVEERALLFPQEVRTRNEYGDLPLHFACYVGRAPAETIAALVRAYPESVTIRNSRGFLPLDAARVNYLRESPHRERVLLVLGSSGAAASPAEEPRAEGADEFPNQPERRFDSGVCVVCMEKPADHIVVPCGHACVCGPCAISVLSRGLCPMGRCRIGAIRKIEDTESSGETEFENEVVLREGGDVAASPAVLAS